MSVRAPHFLLFSDSKQQARPGDWRFVLQAADGTDKIEVEDAEPDMQGERLELLAVVRGLEALDQPSRVTLVTPSRYVQRGLSYGLDEWRANNFQWECHGKMVPIKNHDLWQRVDRALQFHQVECRTWRFDEAHGPLQRMEPIVQAEPRRSEPQSHRLRGAPRRRLRRTLVACERWLKNVSERWWLRAAQCGTALLPLPWLN